MSADLAPITILLQRARMDDRAAVNDLVALLYDQFRVRARRRLFGERAGHTLGPTDLANEALLQILKGTELQRAQNTHQLMRAYSRAVRQVLIDHARRRNTEKRGGDWRRADLDDLAEDVRSRCGSDLSALDEALHRLAAELPREASVVEMRYFGGFNMHEIAAALEVCVSTVERDCRFALRWLRVFLAQEDSDAGGRPAAGA